MSSSSSSRTGGSGGSSSQRQHRSHQGVGAIQVSGYRHDWNHMAQDNESRNPSAHGMILEEPTTPADGETETSTEMVKNKAGLNV